ncbi:hypothetical protein WG901_16075 [Novosphingobium sp. PS1R-30]|uniref:Uncharacterized protein n=1 Tax=Novosphingobium anseongense TaxID=3133436 RepID=A0ABU8RZR6_9SPHN
MTLTLPELAIAAFVVVLIIALVFMARRKRRSTGPVVQDPPGETEAAPAVPARRRQLQSFVDTEWDTPPEPLPEAAPTQQSAFEPEMEFRPPAPLAADFAPDEAEPIVESSARSSPEAEPEDAYTSLPDYDQAVLGRLEEAFEALQAGEITIETYRQHILAEAATVDARVAMLEAEGDSADLQAALVAQESVRWCLDWANDQDETPSA